MMDTINGTFELFGGVFIAISAVKAWREKRVRGVHWFTPAFFWVWGVWNVFYYPHLEQWLSFAAGLGVLSANTAWLALVLIYGHNRKERYARVAAGKPEPCEHGFDDCPLCY